MAAERGKRQAHQRATRSDTPTGYHEAWPLPRATTESRRPAWAHARDGAGRTRGRRWAGAAVRLGTGRAAGLGPVGAAGQGTARGRNATASGDERLCECRAARSCFLFRVVCVYTRYRLSRSRARARAERGSRLVRRGPRRRGAGGGAMTRMSRSGVRHVRSGRRVDPSWLVRTRHRGYDVVSRRASSRTSRGADEPDTK